MSQKSIQELLQECLAALDAGLTPEECLGAWPERRGALEPLLRQALLLRVAFAPGPDQAYQERARERLLFAAGREVSQALSREPDPNFVSQTRSRLLNSAGAQAQEALRAVPPPRLAFWLNARRRLINSATSSASRPARQPLFSLRSGLSAAMVAFAVMIAAFAYFSTESGPRSASAELAALEQQLQQIENQAAAGDPIALNVLIDLSRRTNALVEQLDSEAASAPLAASLPAIIERQQDVVNQVASEIPAPPPELAQAQAQLNQAEEMVRIFAASVETPAPQPTPVATATPAPIATPSTVSTIGPVPDGQARITFLLSDTTLGRSWVEVRTANLRLVVPSTWSIIGVVPDEEGIAVLEARFLRVDGPDVIIIIDTRSAEMNAIVAGEALAIRSDGADGAFISVSELVESAPSVALELSHIIQSFQLLGALADSE